MKMTGNRKNIPFWRRYVDGLYTMEDVHRLGKTAQESSEDEALENLSSWVWEESVGLQPCTDLEREKYKKEARQLLRRIDKRKRLNYCRAVGAIVGVAAMLCLVFGGVGYWRHITVSQVSYLEVFTTYGEHKKVYLPDGTELTLNACSRVRYPNRFIGENRRIELEGEGFFRVARNEEQPFIVDTRSLNVQVLGTSFNVKSYSTDEMVSVDVENGKVQVSLPEAMMRLKANEQVLINTVSGDYIKQRDIHSVAVWRVGSLRFDATPIHDVAKELERHYNCRIVFAEGQVFDNQISGEHENKSLTAVLESIEYTSGIHYKMTGNQIVLYK